MKRLAPILAVVLAAAPAYGTTVKDEVVVRAFCKEQRPYLKVVVKAVGTNQGEVLQSLSAALDYLKREGFKLKVVSQSLSPETEWSKGRYSVGGFEGEVVAWVALNSPFQKGEVVKALKEAQLNGNFWFKLGPLVNRPPKGALERLLKGLKLKAIEKAKEEARFVGKALGKSCQLEEIDFKEFHLKSSGAASLKTLIKLKCR